MKRLYAYAKQGKTEKNDKQFDFFLKIVENKRKNGSFDKLLDFSVKHTISLKMPTYEHLPYLLNGIANDGFELIKASKQECDLFNMQLKSNFTIDVYNGTLKKFEVVDTFADVLQNFSYKTHEFYGFKDEREVFTEENKIMKKVYMKKEKTITGKEKSNLDLSFNLGIKVIRTADFCPKCKIPNDMFALRMSG